MIDYLIKETKNLIMILNKNGMSATYLALRRFKSGQR